MPKAFAKKHPVLPGLRLEQLLKWTKMRIKPSKSHSLSIQYGARKNLISSTMDGERIQLLVVQPVRSQGRLHTANLSEKHMAAIIMKQLSEGLERIDRNQLQGKFKVWCYEFTLVGKVIFPLILECLG